MAKKKSLAREFQEWYDDPDFWDRVPADLLEEFCQMKGVNPRIIEDCSESADSSWHVTFPDGSYMYLANPHEAYFTSFMFSYSYHPDNVDWVKTQRRIEDLLRKNYEFLREVTELFYAFGGQIATK